MARGGRSGNLLRPALLAGCVLFCVAVVGSGLDRHTLDRPSKAAGIPWPFADQALVVRGQARLDEGRAAEALADGENAIRAAPVDPASSALLASARYEAGDRAGADKAFRVAGQMGWRVPLTQAYWLRQALASGDYRVAAMRLDALLRQHPGMLEKPDLVAPFEDNPAGRAALADRIAGGTPWLAAYAGTTEGLSPARVQGRAVMLEQVAQRGVVAGCDAAAPIVSRLAESGAFVAARQLWSAHCPDAKGGLLVDPALAHVRSNGARTYFDWDLIGSSDVSLMVVPGKGGNRIEARNASAAVRQVLRQLLVVPAGRYRLSWEALEAGKPSPRISASIGCTPAGGTAVASGGEIAIAGDCPAHWLSFTLSPGEGDVHFGAIRLDPLR